MLTPSLNDYVSLMFTLFDEFEQYQRGTTGKSSGSSYTYSHKVLLVFFSMMQFRRIYQFKSQRRWLEKHPKTRALLGFKAIPHRTTLSRRYKTLYETLQELTIFISEYASLMSEVFSQAHLVEDKSLFKALGPVWHQKDRKAGRIPAKLRHLDTEASWGKSAYQGWVYGYGLPLTCNQAAFPQLIEVETGSVSETEVFSRKEAFILQTLQPQTLAADNAYTKALRIRKWLKLRVFLLTPAKKWVRGRFAQAYHRLLQSPDLAHCLKKRRTTIEPLFDLIAKVLGTTGRHKQLPVQRLDNVRTCLALATLSVQIAMIVNNIWGLPVRNVSDMVAAFS
jgi:hypothetical protein